MDKNKNLEEKVEKLLGMCPIVAVIGARQCGKSILVKKLRANWNYYDLEQADDYQLITDDSDRKHHSYKLLRPQYFLPSWYY